MNSKKKELVQWVFDSHKMKYPATYQKIHDFIDDRFGKDLCLDTIRHIIASIDELKVVTGIPMENERIFCSPEKIDQYFCKLEEALNCNLVFPRSS